METFEEYSEMILKRLNGYWDQSREFHNDCVQEFRQQLFKIEELAQHLPESAIAECFNQRLQTCEHIKDEFVASATSLSEQNNEVKSQHELELRPNLGHPQQEPLLVTLCLKEDERHQKYVDEIEKMHSKAMEAQLQESAQFYADLQKTAQDLLIFYENIMTASEIVKGEVVQRKMPSIALIHKAQQLMTDDKVALPQVKASLDALLNAKPEIPPEALEPSGPRHWPALNNNQTMLPGFLIENAKQFKQQLAPINVTTDHATLPQHAVIKSRDTMALSYKNQTEKAVEEFEELYAFLKETETKWYEKWQRSVDGVRKLYQVQSVRAQAQKK